MAQQTTKLMVQRQIDLLNLTMYGETQTHIKSNGKFRSIHGRYFLESSYGGYKLCRYCNDGGACSEITPYRGTKRDVYLTVYAINEVLRLDAHRPLLLEQDNARGISHAQH